METQIKSLKKQLRIQQIATLCLAAIITFFYFGNRNLITTKGIAIVDEQGRERILLGSPIPPAANRVRDDSARVQAIWGKKFGPKYLGWYKNYYNSANGIVFLDEKGFDRVAIGESMPDANIGKRIGRAAGMIINDSQGYERSGYGLLNVNGRERIVIGLDRPNGTEGLALGVMEDGAAGFAVMNKKQWLFLGSNAKDSWLSHGQNNLFGLRTGDSSAVKQEFNQLKN